MSHSKERKGGRSLYTEKWNPAAKKYIRTCVLCGRQGYSPTVAQPDFASNPERKVIREELARMFSSPLPLDEHGRCSHCAELQNEA